MSLIDQIESEIRKFYELKSYFLSLGAAKFDEHGFVLNPSGSTQLKPDVLICGLTHGNEVIGLQIINLILEELKSSGIKKNYAFLLNNVEAYLKNIRFIEYDLNRSFLRSSEDQLEFRRAVEIENIVHKLNPSLILDLHQTVEPTLSPFAIIRDDPKLIELAQNISGNLPIITYAVEGFSNKGKTFGEFAFEKEIPALIYEIGAMGFDDVLASQFKKMIINLDLNAIFTQKSQEKPQYYYLQETIPNKDGFKLLPGLVNFQKLEKQQILAQNERNETFKAPEECVLIFPRYKNLLADEHELGYLGFKRPTT